MLKEQKCRSVLLTYSKLFSGGRNPEEITSSLSSPELFIFSLEKLNSFSESSPTSGCLNICINAGDVNSKNVFQPDTQSQVWAKSRIGTLSPCNLEYKNKFRIILLSSNSVLRLQDCAIRIIFIMDI